MAKTGGYVEVANKQILVRVADTFFSRFIGLMGKKEFAQYSGLFFPKCSSIHCFFMRMTIDVVYLDKNYTVLGVETVKPWHIGHSPKHTKHILEIEEGVGCNLNVGETLDFSAVIEPTPS